MTRRLFTYKSEDSELRWLRMRELASYATFLARRDRTHYVVPACQTDDFAPMFEAVLMRECR